MKTITTSIAALLLLTGCDNAQTSAPQRPLPEVGIVTLMSQPVSVVSELTGRTAAAMSAEVRPQVGGIIQKRLFTEGDTVKAGQALYQIDPSSYRAAYNEAAAALKQAQALVQADCQKARRYAQLVKDDGVSRQDAEDAKSTCAQDKASVESKKAALESTRINLNWTTVTAPIAGRIGISSVTPRRAGDRPAGYRAGHHSRAGQYVRRFNPFQRRSAAFTQANPRQQQRYAERVVDSRRRQQLQRKRPPRR